MYMYTVNIKHMYLITTLLDDNETANFTSGLLYLRWIIYRSIYHWMVALTVFPASPEQTKQTALLCGGPGCGFGGPGDGFRGVPLSSLSSGIATTFHYYKQKLR